MQAVNPIREMFPSAGLLPSSLEKEFILTQIFSWPGTGWLREFSANRGRGQEREIGRQKSFDLDDCFCAVCIAALAARCFSQCWELGWLGVTMKRAFP